MKTELFHYVESKKQRLQDMGDYIFDNPEYNYKEYKAAKLLTDYLLEEGFSIEKGIGGLETAFRAVYENGSGGPAIGLLCEYDALENIGHACGHHMQGPVIAAAGVAIKENLKDMPYKLVIYGTPAEETEGGKIIMIKNNCFKDIDVALMFHAGPSTCTDIKCMALSPFRVIFKGKGAHAAIQPESGRSAFDALLLSFNAIEFLREHVKEDTRMHYTVLSAGGPDNVVPSESIGTFSLRSYNRTYLNTVIERFKDIIKGAALMTGTTYEIIEDLPFDSKVPVIKLNNLLMENAELVGAPSISPPREKTGSTDFGNVMYHVPGSCIRVAFVPIGTPPHSKEYLNAGKSQEAHQTILIAAKVLAATCYDLISNSSLLAEIKEEFMKNKLEMSK